MSVLWVVLGTYVFVACVVVPVFALVVHIRRVARERRARTAGGDIAPAAVKLAAEERAGWAATGRGRRFQRRGVLTNREREVLEALAAGLSLEETADELGASARTARSYVATAMRKLGARTHTHAVVRALARGEIALERSERRKRAHT